MEFPLEQQLKRLFISRSDSSGTMAVMQAHQLTSPTPPHARHAWRVLLALLWAACWTMPAIASDRHDHERARQALQAGQILPLGTVLERLARDQPGQVLEVELEHEQSTWLYEVKLLQTGGRVLKFKVDAATGAVLPHNTTSRKHP